MEPEDFEGREPTLRIEEYLLGRTRAWGLFQDRFGRVRRPFTVDIDGRYEDGELILEENFVYADGETDQRTWRIRRVDDHSYIGHAGDIVGEAHGRTFGNALNWRYTLALPVGGRTWNVDFDDWMFLQPDGVLINRADVKKLGIKVGDVTLVFQKAPIEPAQAGRDADKSWRGANDGIDRNGAESGEPADSTGNDTGSARSVNPGRYVAQ